MTRDYFITFLFMFYGWCFSQSIDAKLYPNQFFIGDPVEFKLQVTIANKQLVQWPESKKNWSVIPLNDSMSTYDKNTQYFLESISEVNIDTIQKHKDSLSILWKITVTAWDSMSAILPPVKIIIDSLAFSTQPLVFSADLTPVEEGVEMFDIFEVFSDVSVEEHPLWYFGGRLALLLLIIGILIYLFKKFFGKNEIQTNPVQKSLRERTIIALEALFNSKLYLSNLKEYYFELSMILRRFLSEKYGDPYLEMTTHEIKYRLQKSDLTIEQIQQIISILQQSDLVKFAKNKPSDSDVMNQTAELKRLIHEIADLDLGKENE